MDVLRYFFLHLFFIRAPIEFLKRVLKQRSKNAVVIDRAISTDC